MLFTCRKENLHAHVNLLFFPVFIKNAFRPKKNRPLFHDHKSCKLVTNRLFFQTEKRQNKMRPWVESLQEGRRWRSIFHTVMWCPFCGRNASKLTCSKICFQQRIKFPYRLKTYHIVFRFNILRTSAVLEPNCYSCSPTKG